jgi:hypothetical protein
MSYVFATLKLAIQVVAGLLPSWGRGVLKLGWWHVAECDRQKGGKYHMWSSVTAFNTVF